MRVKDIKITFRMTIPFDKPDLNGVVYTKEAILKAFSADLSGLPVWNMNNDPLSPVGAVTGCRIVEQNEDNIVVEVSTNIRGGTNETVLCNENNKVGEYEIGSFGLFCNEFE